MGFEQKLQDLMRLQRTAPESYLEELDKPWPGMQSDIETAMQIMLDYQNEGNELRLLDGFRLDEETGECLVRMPEWQMRIMAEFRILFDEDEAQYRYMKTYNEVIGKLMTGPGPH